MAEVLQQRLVLLAGERPAELGLSRSSATMSSRWSQGRNSRTASR
jgi:hypothetical protein